MEFPDILKVVSDLTRLRIMHLIDKRGPELCVCDMVAALRLPQGTVSRQLMMLRHLGLVADRRDGKWNHYSLARPVDPEPAAILQCLRKCWNAQNGGGQFAEDLAEFDDLQARNAIVRCEGDPKKRTAAGGARAARGSLQ